MKRFRLLVSDCADRVLTFSAHHPWYSWLGWLVLVACPAGLLAVASIVPKLQDWLSENSTWTAGLVAMDILLLATLRACRLLVVPATPDPAVAAAIAYEFDNLRAVSNERLGNTLTAIPTGSHRDALGELMGGSQIQDLALLTQQVFEHTTLSGEAEVRVVVALMDSENLPESFSAYVPPRVRPLRDAAGFRDPLSGFVQAADKKDLLVWPDVGRAIDNGQLLGTRDTDRKHDRGGALLCYPVVCPRKDRAIYVVSVYANRAGSFSEGRHKVYRWLLRKVEARLLTEHYRGLIKEWCDGS